VPQYVPHSPISEYFDATDSLKVKILSSGTNDSEMFGLLTIGVISAVEFYFRSIFCRVAEICPLAHRHAELILVPAGAADFFAESAFPRNIASFENESLADGKKIKSFGEKFTGIKLGDDTSVASAIDDFDRLCELRHCLVHSRGYVGLKAAHALELDLRSPQKILLKREHVFEALKTAHNAVRAVNRHLADTIVNRWIDAGVLTGDWRADRELFESIFVTFSMPGQDAYGGIAYRAYAPFRRAAKARAAAALARVAS
jgi:hypothetical protein